MSAPRCECGHSAIDHHGLDGRVRGDAGCMGGPSLTRDDWCRCHRTCTQVMETNR